MNARVISILLAVLCLGLGATLWWVNDRARKDREAAAAKADTLAAEVIRLETRVGEQTKEKAALEVNLTRQTEAAGAVSNKLQLTQAELAKLEQESKLAAESALRQIENREKTIASLQTEKDELTVRMKELTQELDGVKARIADTERKLASSEGDRDVLKTELRRLLAEKADLEKRYNDVATVKQQLQRLREEAYLARRAEITRKGGAAPFEIKGATLLQQGIRRTPATNAGVVNPNLEVEVRTDGSGRAVQPGAR